MSELTGTQASAQIEAARQQQLDDFRKNAAYKALMQTHGPAAGDPQAWDQVEQAQTRQDTEPYAAPEAAADVQTKQLANQDTTREQSGRALYSVAQMAKNAAKPDGSIDPAAYDQLFNNPLVQRVTGITPDQVAQAKPLITGPGGVQHLDTIANAALGPGKVSGAAIPVQNADGTFGVIKTTDTGRVINLDLGGAQPAGAVQKQEALGQGQQRIDVARQRVQQEAAGAGVTLTPAALDMAAKQYATTGVLPNFGYGKQGAALRTQVANQAAAAPSGAPDVAANAQVYKTRQTYLNDLAKSGPTTAGGLARSAGAVFQHIDTLDQFVDALGNKNIQLANSLSQKFKEETGKPLPTAFNAQKTIIGDELTRYLIARGGTKADREQMQAGLDRANSPAQLKMVIKTYRDDIGAQLYSQYSQAKGIGADKQFLGVLTPEARFILTGVAEPGLHPHSAAVQSHAANNNGGWSIQRVQ